MTSTDLKNPKYSIIRNYRSSTAQNTHSLYIQKWKHKSKKENTVWIVFLSLGKQINTHKNQLPQQTNLPFVGLSRTGVHTVPTHALYMAKAYFTHHHAVCPRASVMSRHISSPKTSSGKGLVSLNLNYRAYNDWNR